MKKLKLKALELGATEILSRDQLKNVLGGRIAGVKCTYTIQGEGMVTDTMGDGAATPPAEWGYATWQDWADDFCLHDNRCDNVDCN